MCVCVCVVFAKCGNVLTVFNNLKATLKKFSQRDTGTTTLLKANLWAPQSGWEDDVPFPKVGNASSLDGNNPPSTASSPPLPPIVWGQRGGSARMFGSDITEKFLQKMLGTAAKKYVLSWHDPL